LIVTSPQNPGLSYPLGAAIVRGGVNFSVYSKHATGMDLLLFDRVDAAQPYRVVSLDRHDNRTRDYWHAFVPGLAAGQIYAWRAHGPFDPTAGLRFDARRILLDPYGRAVAVPDGYRRSSAAALREGGLGAPLPDCAGAMKSVVVDTAAYDWEDDAPVRRPFRETIIYEAHVRGFTARANSGVAPGRRGTYAGFIEKIPYLGDLGVTAVELLPVFQYDAQDAPQGHANYWGYSPVSFFAPHAGYASQGTALGAIDEFRDLVKALHRAGLEVILDVVFNHTAEGDERGPTFCFRGLANDNYYILGADRASYVNDSGTGNTIDANSSIVRRLILDSLRYWVQEMHVDGFRFDLAAVLSRDEEGRPMADPPIVWDIENDPVLAGTKLIAEAWDAGGLYEVGSFVGDHWKEWNGRFRDDVRAFVKGDPGKVWAFGQRFQASPDIYGHEEREPEQSINFVTAHDGFTLNDLVSYDDKHNEANGEGNRDGSDANLSWNCGIEGPTDDPAVEALRRRQIRNFLAIELLAMGVPMIVMGDEVRRSQGGNNNAYSQDNETSWFDWDGLNAHAGILRFTRKLTRARASLEELVDASADLSLSALLRTSPVVWSGIRYGQPDLGAESRSLALTIWGHHVVVHLIFNAFWEALEFELPPGPRGWRRIVDTTLEAPDDFPEASATPKIESGACRAGPRSVVVLASPPESTTA